MPHPSTPTAAPLFPTHSPPPPPPSYIEGDFMTLSLLSLVKSGFTPTLKDLNNFLFILSQAQKSKFILHLFSQMSSNQINGDSKTLAIFTKALLREQKYEEALRFLRTHMGKTKILHKNRIFDTLIQGFCRNENDPEKGLFVLQECLRTDGILASSFTFCCLIHCFSSQGKMDRVIEVLELMSSGKFKYPFENFVCSSVIYGFVKIGKPEIAVGFFENAVNSGSLKANIVTYTALLSAYFRLGRIEEASEMVSRMEENGLSFDVLFYSNWIHGFFREGIVEEAFRKYQKMVSTKVEMDAVAYTVIIDGISKEGNVEKAVGFLSKMIKDGVKPNIITLTAIILGFCKKGKLEEAFAFFKMVEDFEIKVDEIIYAILIDGVCRKGDFDCAFRLLDEMDNKGVKPSVITYNTIINGLCKAGRTSDADDISKNIVGDVFTYSTLLQGYVQEGNATGMLETKKRFEAAGISADVVMCTILIKSLFMMGLFEDALAIYKAMPEMDLEANSVTYCTMIDGYCKVGRIDEALEIFDDFRRTSDSSSATCYDCIIHGLCQNGMVDMAIEVFMELVERSLSVDWMLYMRLVNVAFNTKGGEGVLYLIHRMKNIGGELFEILCNDAISFLFRRGSSHILFDVFMVMWTNGFMLMSKPYYLILKFFLKDGKMMFTQTILAMFVKQYGMTEPRVNRILLDYMCMKDVNNALKFFRKMNENSFNVTFSASVLETLRKDGRALDAYNLIVGTEDKLHDMDMVNYSNIISGLCKEGHVGKALDLCEFARNKGVSLSIATYNAVMNGLCHHGCLVEALRLFDSLDDIKLLPSETTYVILIDSLSKEGLLMEARRLFDSMSLTNIKPNTRAYNSLINGYCKLGQMQEALKLLLDLEAVNLKPDEFTVSAVIHAYCQNGDTEEALGFFSEFKIKGILPDFLGFMCLIRGLIAKGRMEESRTILREMLQAQSVTGLLNRIDTEVEMESVQNFLVILCERGSIQEAVAILDEVGSMFFPVRRRSSSNDGSAKHKPCYMTLTDTAKSEHLTCTSENNIDHSACNDEKLQNISKTYAYQGEKISISMDFDSSYALIASLCSKGEIGKANKLVEMMSDLL
ncbi:hypothetical protein ACH5RR_003356 [Cinchona calisaya]|uniref:Pentatricopeptide repeat-containing protein n=1 Tax=Cinchona calisaya TaxID=153742 RepID=A0ABD3AUJ7_9GENT